MPRSHRADDQLAAIVVLISGLIFLGPALIYCQDVVQSKGDVAAMIAFDAFDQQPGYEKLFASVGETGIANLTSGDNDSIALAAAWETVRRVRGTQAELHERAQWFMGFFEGRTRCQPPTWWRDWVLGLRRQGNTLSFPANDEHHHLFKEAMRPQIKDILRDRHLELTIGANRLVLPTSANEGVGMTLLSTHFLPNVTYATFHTDAGTSHRLYCVDRKTDRVLWQSTVFANPVVGYTGLQVSSLVEIVEVDNRVFVFGGAAFGLYAEGFDRNDGSPELRLRLFR